MEAILLSLLNSIPSPYSDLLVVILIFGLIVLLSLIILFFFEEKPKEIVEAPESDDFAEPKTREIPTREYVGEPEETPSKKTEEIAPSEEVEQAEGLTSEIEIAEETTIQKIQEVRVEELEPERVKEEIADTKEGLLARLRSGLSKTNKGLFSRLSEIVSKREVDESLWEDFEETLIMADVGVSTTMKLRERIEKKLEKKSLSNPSVLTDTLKEEVREILIQGQGNPISVDTSPFVVMIAGVNGVGKTTTIGKLAHKFKQEQGAVMVAAGDTFRAAATEQLEVWSKRVGTEFIRGQSGQDPSSVAYDAAHAASTSDVDVLIIDTAGRLHTKGNLMEELKKMKRVVGRALEGAPHEILLVLDATTGQNAIQQAKLFNEVLGVTGIVLTKLDGTAKGGVIIAIADELNIPVKYIGIGEGLSDLREFNAEEFVEALFYSGDETIH